MLVGPLYTIKPMYVSIPVFTVVLDRWKSACEKRAMTRWLARIATICLSRVRRINKEAKLLTEIRVYNTYVHLTLQGWLTVTRVYAIITSHWVTQQTTFCQFCYKMSSNTDMDPDCYTNSTLRSSCPSTSDNFVASLHSFLAANRITATGMCTMNIQNQNTGNKVIVSFNVEAEMMVLRYVHSCQIITQDDADGKG